MPETVTLTPDSLVIVWGIVLSLGLEYLPGVAPWFANLTEANKRAINALGVLVVALLIFVGGCANLYESLACTQSGLLDLLALWFTALVANQTTHSVFKKSEKTE